MTIEKIDLYASFFSGLGRMLDEDEENLIRRKLYQSKFTSPELYCLGKVIGEITRDVAAKVSEVFELLVPFIIKKKATGLPTVEEEIKDYLKNFCIFQISCFNFTPADRLSAVEFIELEESAKKIGELKSKELIAIRSSSICKHFVNSLCTLPNTT
jgi:hypothetical protein